MRRTESSAANIAIISLTTAGLAAAISWCSVLSVSMLKRQGFSHGQCITGKTGTGVNALGVNWPSQVACGTAPAGPEPTMSFHLPAQQRGRRVSVVALSVGSKMGRRLPLRIAPHGLAHLTVVWLAPGQK